MGSAFLTTFHLGLSLFAVIHFIKSIAQFGLPNHPARFSMYLVHLCVASYLVMQSLTDLHFVTPWHFMSFSAYPLVIGSLALLMEVTSIVGQVSQFRQRILSRIPLIAGLVTATFFNLYAEKIAVGFICVSVLFLIVSVGKTRYQKRILFKMVLFFGLFIGCKASQIFWVYTFGVLFLFPTLFYLFIFQQSFGISSLVEDYQENSGDSV
jgi:hypothetical protein